MERLREHGRRALETDDGGVVLPPTDIVVIAAVAQESFGIPDWSTRHTLVREGPHA
jgi:hypothetical protein